MRIDEARDLIEKARAAATDAPPEGTLPVEPTLTYPVASLKEVLSAKPVKPSDYMFNTGDFEVAMITPVLTYGVQYAEDHGCPVIATANHCNELIRLEIRSNSHRNDMFFVRVISDKNGVPGGCAKMADAAWPHGLR